MLASRLFSRRAIVAPQAFRAFSVPAVAEDFVDVVTPDTQISTLANGVKVATIECGGNFSSVAVLADMGSRDETAATAGSTHVLSHLAFRSTKSKSSFRITREAERMGGTIAASPFRETTILSGDVLRPKSGALLDTLAAPLTQPALLPWEVKEAAAAASKESADVAALGSSAVPDHLAYAAGYSGSLGNALFHSAGVYDVMTPEAVQTFLESQLHGNGICVSAVNVDHAEFVERSNELFGLLPANRAAPRAPANYTGGDLRRSDSSPLTTVMLSFEGPSWSQEHVLASSVLQTLMGGGQSFSAGGPGKGMMSRLYREVLARHHDVQSAQVYNNFYSDTGVFGVYGETLPESAGRLVDTFSAQLTGMASKIAPEELQRAKNQLKSNIQSNLEQRHVVVDDLGRQVLSTGKRRSGEALYAQIDALTAEDVLGAARKIVSSPLTVAAHGETGSMPRYDEIAARFK